jgi:UDP-N-acetylmuramate dehydrogenase
LSSRNKGFYFLDRSWEDKALYRAHNTLCARLDIIGMFKEDILLSKYSNYRIGGPAKYFFEAKNIDEIIKALDKWRHLAPYHPAPSSIRRGGVGSGVFILGAGTNILFNDEGFNGLVLKPNIQFIKGDGNALRVGAGVPISQILNYAINEGLSGLEWAAGLPGTLGGAIRGNAGSFDGEMQAIVKEVVCLDILTPQTKIVKRSSGDCRFGYRSSVFKLNGNKEIIVEATLVFRKGDRKLMEATMEENINYRREKQPLEHPSIGSIFKNVNLQEVAKKQRKIFNSVIKNDPFPAIPAAHLISEAGLAGISCGGAMISPKHSNFIVNILNATAKDVKNLIELAKKEVKKKFKVDLEEEIVRI